MLAHNIPEAAIKALCDQFQLQLAGPENCTKISPDLNLSILNPHTIEWQPRPGFSSSASLLDEIFELQAKRTPECTAIDFLEPENPRESSNRLQILSYKDVNNKLSDAPSKDLYYIPPFWESAPSIAFLWAFLGRILPFVSHSIVLSTYLSAVYRFPPIWELVGSSTLDIREQCSIIEQSADSSLIHFLWWWLYIQQLHFSVIGYFAIAMHFPAFAQKIKSIHRVLQQQ